MKITRIAYNSAGWQRPTGEASDLEAGKTYNRMHGFGHEDWLFRSEWQIDGWRYAFIQGVNKSHRRLVEAGQPIDLLLFTIQPDKRRRYVAAIRAVECLDDRQAIDALEQFRHRGWLDVMRQEVIAAGGKDTALGAAKWAKHVLNVRFRSENVTPFPRGTYADADDPVQKLMRYMLYDEANIGRSGKQSKLPSKVGSTKFPKTKSFQRRAVAPTECTPEHARMQKKLMEELRAEYPRAKVVREQNFIDVSVETETERLLFEIKSDLEPKTVIRQALGQILEYAFHSSRPNKQSVKLIIVGRRKLSGEDEAYLNLLRTRFGLPVGYRVVAI